MAPSHNVNNNNFRDSVRCRSEFKERKCGERFVRESEWPAFIPYTHLVWCFVRSFLALYHFGIKLNCQPLLVVWKCAWLCLFCCVPFVSLTEIICVEQLRENQIDLSKSIKCAKRRESKTRNYEYTDYGYHLLLYYIIVKF